MVVFDDFWINFGRFWSIFDVFLGFFNLLGVFEGFFFDEFLIVFGNDR
jgi:hypothetical protein